MNKEIIDHVFSKFEMLVTPTGDIIMKQIPVEIWGCTMWLIVFSIMTSIFLIFTCYCIYKMIEEDFDYIFGVVIIGILTMLFSIGIFCNIYSLKQLEINPKYYMAEKGIGIVKSK